MSLQSDKKTGYPSIDKPWLKYYSEKEKTLTVPEGSMFDYLYNCNSEYPNDIALEYYGHTYSYFQLFQLIDKCCRNLSAMGVKKGDVVTVQAIPLPQVVVVIYALTRIGACGNMLYPDAKAEDVILSMEKTSSRVLIVVDKILSMYETDLPDTFDHSIILLNISDQMSFFPRVLTRKKTSYTQKNLKLRTISWQKFINGEGTPYQDNHDGSIPAFMLRTGGTTGIPKEVVLSSKNFNAVSTGVYHSQLCDRWERRKNSLLLQPPFIAFGISSGIHNSLTFGTKLIIVLDVSPNAVTKLFLKYKPNYITIGTVQIEQILEDIASNKKDLSYLEMLAVGGEAMTPSFEERLKVFLESHNCYITPIKGYGLTETTGCVIAETIKAHKTGSVGIPIGVANIKIIDTETGKELPYDSPGEICLSSLGIMDGYYKNQQATDEVIEIVDGVRWLHTGDIGVVSKDGLLEITGRIKRIIVCKEGIVYHKVFPLLIENQLVKIPGVHEISIVGRPDEALGNVLIAYVVPDNKENFEQVKNELVKYCTGNLEKYECPVEYVCMQELPRTMIGKVNYRMLEDMAKEKNLKPYHDRVLQKRSCHQQNT